MSSNSFIGGGDWRIMIEWLRQWTVVRKEDVEHRVSLIRQLEQKVINANLDLEKADFTIKELTKIPDINDAEYWNNKWKQSSVWYSAPKRMKVIDYVRYRKIPDVEKIALLLIDTIPSLRDDKDSVALEVMKWIDKQKFQYKSDKGEDWFSPEDFFLRAYGDCDDFGIFEYYLIREIFKQLGQWDVVKHRLKCICGNVNNRGNIPSGAGGHFYLNWLHSDGEWYTVESTYYRPNAIGVYGKIPQKLNKVYGTIWFSFNEDFSWAQNSLTVSKKDFDKLS
jgi:hypothetical protein